MTKRKTHEEFVAEVKELVGYEYEVLGHYEKSGIKILMRHNCDECDNYEYSVTPNKFLRGRRCPKCNGCIKKTTEKFKEEVFNLVGSEYKVIGEYINTNTLITILHDNCKNEFNVKPSHFLYEGSGCRCPYCYGRLKINTEKFKQEVFDLVGYEYSVLGEYTMEKEKIKMRHNECGYEYSVHRYKFLDDRRCPKCANNIKKTTDQFKEEVYELFGDEFVITGEYENNHTKLTIYHTKCGCEFEAPPNRFLQGQKCPCESTPKGEKIISDFLNSNNLNYKTQYRFPDCKYKNTLPFDFAVFDDKSKLMLLIEYDGQQHFDPIKFFGGKDGFKQRKIRDNIKNDYCKENDIPLLRIPYWEFDNIENILKCELHKLIMK